MNIIKKWCKKEQKGRDQNHVLYKYKIEMLLVSKLAENGGDAARETAKRQAARESVNSNSTNNQQNQQNQQQPINNNTNAPLRKG